MEQALGNLISNALRFTPAGGTIRLAARKVGEDLELEVSDTGPGISPAVVGKMFEPYCQGEPGTGSGLGLGLHICRGIVENHGGRIWARSIPGHGASFTIRVPLAPG
jgi:signal transduction histidine kinase